MRIGNLDGTPDEIKNFLVDNGINADDLFQPFKKLHFKWIVIPTVFFIIISFILWIMHTPPLAIYGLLIIFEFLSILWLTAAIQLRFKNIAVSLFCLFMLSIIFSFCSGITGIKEAIEILQRGSP